MENLEIRIMPEKVLFRENCIIITDSENGRYRILYKDIIYAYIRIQDSDTGECLAPEITDITKETDGELILYDNERRQWIIRTDRTREKAGMLFEKLCIHVPYILAGGQDWFNCSQEEDFKMIGQMAEIMREC